MCIYGSVLTVSPVRGDYEGDAKLNHVYLALEAMEEASCPQGVGGKRSRVG
jgi:hypothetical protein